MASEDERIRIVASPCGRFKTAESSGGYGAAATATFIHDRTPLLAGEIQHARALYIRSWSVNGVRPSAAEIVDRFPRIAELCVDEDINRYVADQGSRTPVSAALEIMQGLFPTYSVKSIARMARAPRVRKP